MTHFHICLSLNTAEILITKAAGTNMVNLMILLPSQQQNLYIG